MNMSATSVPIAIKFKQKHHVVGGKAALGFRPNRIRTLVSMATDSSQSSHRVIMGKILWSLKRLHFDPILLILTGNKDNHNITDEFVFQPDPIPDFGVSCP